MSSQSCVKQMIIKTMVLNKLIIFNHVCIILTCNSKRLKVPIQQSKCINFIYPQRGQIKHLDKLFFPQELVREEGNRANSLCGYFLCGDHCKEITTAVGKSKYEF
jgi:hypothetical protein